MLSVAVVLDGDHDFNELHPPVGRVKLFNSICRDVFMMLPAGKTSTASGKNALKPYLPYLPYLPASGKNASEPIISCPYMWLEPAWESPV